MKLTGAPIKRDYLLLSAICFLCMLSGALLQSVFAYEMQVQSDLKYSRNALLQQRSELERACDIKATQIQQLQGEIDRLRRYLADTDRSISHIDNALASGS